MAEAQVKAEKFDVPTRPGWRKITAGQARYITENLISGAQRKKLPAAGRYSRIMKKDEWRWDNPQPVIFSKAGKLEDGLQRLTAQQIAGITGKYFIQTGAPDDIFSVVDSGTRRSASQFIDHPRSDVIARTVSHLAYLSEGKVTFDRGFGRLLSIPDVLQWAEEWPELFEYVDDVCEVYKNTKIHRSTHLAVLVQAARTENKKSIPAWIDGLLGIGVDRLEDPRHVLVNKFGPEVPAARRRQLASSQDPLSYLIITKTWNQYVTGVVKDFRGKRSANLPKVEGFSWL